MQFNVRFLTMAIKIQQYNGNNYNYLPPTYASNSTQAENSDKLDGYHATDFLKGNELGTFDMLNRYMNSLKTGFLYKESEKVYYDAQEDSSEKPIFELDYSWFLGICKDTTKVYFKGDVGAEAYKWQSGDALLIDNNYHRVFYLDQGFDNAREASFTITSPAFLLYTASSDSFKEKEYINADSGFLYKIITPGTYGSKTGNGNRHLYLEGSESFKMERWLISSFNQLETSYSFTKEKMTTGVWINNNQFYYDSAYLPQYLSETRKSQLL